MSVGLTSFTESTVSLPAAKAGDIYDMGKQARMAVRFPKAGGTLSQKWCKGWESTTENQPDENEYRIQMIYAYPSDGENRFRRFANMIQRDAQFLDSLVLMASKRKLSIAWDRGGPCGDDYLDIRTMKMPKTKKWHRDHTSSDIGWHGATHIRELMRDENAPDPAPRKLYFVYFDQSRSFASFAYKNGDDAPGLESKNLSYTSVGMTLARGSSYKKFFRGNTAESFFGRRRTVPHEIFHMLGAVHSSAPNYGAYGHCVDDWDLMCMDAGGGPGFYVNTKRGCKGWDYRIDCQKNDYFNPNPKPGSYLDTHWNIAFSPFMENSKLRQPALWKLDYDRWFNAGVNNLYKQK